ncbi:MAG TPA: ATP-binding protein [Longimicrobiaceae bacterium]|nr:ATP-binding protein [Longimicrobiaceae bacterium]
MSTPRPLDRLPEPRRILWWVYLGRVTLALAIFTAAAWVWTAVSSLATLAATLILFVSAVVTALSFAYTHLRRREPGRNFLYAQVAYDVVLVTAVVVLTGGKESAFAPLYILVICAAAVLLPILGGILIAALASMLYLAGIVWSAHGVPDAGVSLQIVLFTAVALVTGYLGDRLRRTGTVLGQVESELRSLRLDTDDILGNVSTGVLTVDETGRLAYLNPAGSELLGLSGVEWMGRRVIEELDERAPGLGIILDGTLRSGAGVARFETGETPDGIVLGASTTPMGRRSGGASTVTAIFQDITGRRKLDALRRRAERLEAVAELSASLAHEIKNQLASIRSAVEQLAAGVSDVEDRDVLRGLVLRESDRLSRLLTEFLDFARVEVRAAAPVDVMAVARNAVALVRAHPAADGCTLTLAVDPGEEGVMVSGDEDLLHRAVLNLVLNGVQWAGPAGTVEVQVKSGSPEKLDPELGSPRSVRIRVRDSGPGIPAEDVDLVFDPFYTQRPGGTGLGLALVQRAAEAHGGAVVVEAGAPGWGATFCLYLPALSAVGPAPAASEFPEEAP